MLIALFLVWWALGVAAYVTDILYVHHWDLTLGGAFAGAAVGLFGPLIWLVTLTCWVQTGGKTPVLIRAKPKS